MLCYLLEIFVIAFRTFRIVEIMYRAAIGAGHLRNVFIYILCLRKIKLKLAALGADVYFDLECARGNAD